MEVSGLARLFLDEEREWSVLEKADKWVFAEHNNTTAPAAPTWCRVSASEIFLRHASCSALKPDAALDSTVARWDVCLAASASSWQIRALEKLGFVAKSRGALNRVEIGTRSHHF